MDSNEDKKIEEKTSNKDDYINKEKLKLPKRKYAIIHGYFGQNYFGNQKNVGVVTVESELETALYKAKFISECNYGHLGKIDWMRASRTDKGVSAIMNVVSCKLHKHPDLDENQMKKNVNELLPQDIRVFRIIEVSSHFNSKDNNDSREYHYIVPTFVFEPIEKDSKMIEKNDIKVPENYRANYKYRITNELHDKLKEFCNNYLGTKNYHNYTKGQMFSQMNSQRIMKEVTCDELIEEGDLQLIKFKIIGQSFLYNQIRKMIGMLIDCMRNNKDIDYFKNSFLANKIDIPKAPAEGLYLMNIDYSNYNKNKLNKKNNIFLSEDDKEEMEKFRKQLATKIKDTEINLRVFSIWLWKLDNKREWTL